MNRRSLLKWLGVGSAAAVTAPVVAKVAEAAPAERYYSRADQHGAWVYSKDGVNWTNYYGEPRGLLTNAEKDKAWLEAFFGKA